MVNSIPIASFKSFSKERPKDGQVVLYNSKVKKKIAIGYYFEFLDMVICNDKIKFNIVDGDKWAEFNYSRNVDISV